MMSFRTLVAGAVVAAWTLALVTVVSARLIENWSYQRLFDTADVVVVGAMVSTKGAEKPERLPIFTDVLEGRVTTFKVEGLLKGKAGEKIEVLHCVLKENASVENGPLLAEFREKGRRLRIVEIDGAAGIREEQESDPRYLLFLKAGKDGRLEPVAGQVDSSLSVRELRGAW